MKQALLVLFPLPSEYLRVVAEHYDIIEGFTPATRQQAIAAHGTTLRIVLTTGASGLTAAEIDALPQLEFISSFGAGHEAVDVAHAHARGIVVVNGAGANDSCVADHALGLLLNAVRNIGGMDKACRQGLFREDMPLFDQLAGMRVGIIGLGNIGRKIARRLEGFDVEIGYHTRTPVPSVPYTYFGELEAMASWSRHLVIAAPGGLSTHHMVGLPVLQVLGEKGWLVNVGRGSIVDTAALVQALQAGLIGGAALDVYEDEPAPPTALFPFPNVLLTPHVGGSSPQAMWAAVRLFLDNAGRHFAGEALLTPVR